ncbi:hypothetical protein [Cedecea davisae]|uniref:hypothetical protein n=1 Tax=Cedecea davisae TaxID=158484 RepID=UPI0029CAC307|nr:hypothetical protein [Cedecea davisae]
MQYILARTALSVAAGLLFIAQATASTPVWKGSPVINTLFAQTKPQCIGRYVIDVPESDDLYRRLEAHVYLNGISFVITTDIRDFSAPKYKERLNILKSQQKNKQIPNQPSWRLCNP